MFIQGIATISTDRASYSEPLECACSAGLVRARSGLALKHGIICPNAPGTIDSDYRGECGVILANIGAEPFVIRRGERIAQLVVARHERADWVEVEALDDTARGAGGFGSTGR